MGSLRGSVVHRHFESPQRGAREVRQASRWRIMAGRRNDMPTGSMLAALLLTLPTQTPAPREVRDVSPLLDAARKDSKVPGLVAAVVRGGEVTALGASGVRKQGEATPITSADK